MARKPRPALELLSDIGSLGFDLQHYSDENIAAAVDVLRSVNAPMFDFLVKVLGPGPLSAAPLVAQGAQDELGYDPIVKGANTERAVIVDYLRSFKMDELFVLAAQIEDGNHYPPLPPAPPLGA